MAGIRGRGQRGVFGLAAALAVLATTRGGLVAADALSGAGPQPSVAAPTTTFAYAAVDLDPPAAQKLAALQLGRRLAHATGGHGEDGRDAVLRPLLARLLPSLDYARAVRPWRGDRVGVAVFRAPTGRSETVAIVRCGDGRAARGDVRRFGGGAHVVVRRGYAVLGSPSAVRAAVGVAGALADRPAYRHDVASLPDARVAVGWLDPAGAGGTVTALRGLGRMVAAARLTGHAIEVDAALEIAAGPARGDAQTLLRTLPDSTVAGIAVAPGFAFAPLDRALASTGLATSASKGVALAYGGLHLTSLPDVGAVGPGLSAPGVGHLSARARQGRTAVATSSAYADELLRGGDLSRLDGYRDTIGTDGPPLVMAAYADPARLLPFLPGVSDASAFDGFGIAAWREGAVIRARLRLTVR